MGIESSDEMAEFVGSDILMYGKTESLEDIMADYAGVTMDQVTALFPYLARENLYLYYIK
jgi:uncharacterized protein (DUF433 family)